MSSGWVWPLSSLRVTDEFGYRIHPIYGDRRLHRGIDLAARAGDPVYAAAVGDVSWASYNGGEGNSVHVDHPDGSRTKYFHNSSLRVVRGQGVAEAQHIAGAGTTGASTGVHVHYETHTSTRDSPVDPRQFMADRGASFGSTTASGGTPIPIETPEQADEREINMSTQQILDAIESFRQQAVGNQDVHIKPALAEILRQMGNDDEQIERIMTAVRRESRTRVYQINEPGDERHGLGAAIDTAEGVYRPYGSLAELQNDQRLSVVAPERLQITAAEFDRLRDLALARLAELQSDPAVPSVTAASA